jgi:DHA1 family multidrug resistance protein-like MFS transporter
VEDWRRNQVAVTAASFVGFTGFTMVMPFLASYIQQLGVTDVGDVAVWTGLTLGVTPALSAMCSPLWGRVADRFGNKVLLLRALASSVVVMGVMAQAAQPWHLFVLRAVQGLVAGYGPLTVSMAAMSVPAQQMARAIGTVQTAQRIGPAVGPVLGGLLAAAIGLRDVFLVAAAVYAAAFGMVALMYTEPPRAPRKPGERGRVSFGTVLAFENFVLLMVVIFGLQIVDRSFGPILLLHVSELGYGGSEAALLVGILFSVLAVCAACGNQLAAALLKRGTTRAVIAGSVLIAAVALGLFALVRSAWLMTITIAAFGAAIGTALTTTFTAAGSVVPREAHGVGFGFLSSASLIGSAISPILSGLVASRSIRVVFLSGAAILTLIAVMVRRLMAERDLTFETAPSVDES